MKYFMLAVFILLLIYSCDSSVVSTGNHEEYGTFVIDSIFPSLDSYSNGDGTTTIDGTCRIVYHFEGLSGMIRKWCIELEPDDGSGYICLRMPVESVWFSRPHRMQEINLEGERWRGRVNWKNLRMIITLECYFSRLTHHQDDEDIVINNESILVDTMYVHIP